MSPHFEGGLQWCYNGFVKIQKYGPILRDPRIYCGTLISTWDQRRPRLRQSRKKGSMRAPKCP